MATTTPNFGWSVPTSTDLVKDGATAIETLGDSIDASLVDLKGGTTGQYLAKNSNTDMDFVWSASSSTFAGVRVFKSSSQTISNATVTDLTFDSETFDTNTFHSTTTNTDRLTVPSGKAGKYLVIAKMSFNGGANGIRQVYIYKNTTVYDYLTWQNVSNSNSDICLNTIVDLTVGDYVKMAVWQNNGGNLVANSGSDATNFSMQFLGA